MRTNISDLITTAVYRAGGLDAPGGGYLYVTELERLATYVPQEALQRTESSAETAMDEATLDLQALARS